LKESEKEKEREREIVLMPNCKVAHFDIESNFSDDDCPISRQSFAESWTGNSTKQPTRENTRDNTRHNTRQNSDQAGVTQGFRQVLKQDSLSGLDFRSRHDLRSPTHTHAGHANGELEPEVMPPRQLFRSQSKEPIEYDRVSKVVSVEFAHANRLGFVSGLGLEFVSGLVVRLKVR
jgi:hypothetical protein